MRILFAALLLLALPVQARDMYPLAIQRADGTTATFSVELATTEATREYGLMNRTKLPEDTGMLFLYDRPGSHAFWMKDTLVPLDMLFFTANGQLVYIHPNARPHDLTPVLPTPDRHNICAILELPGGQAAKSALSVGDRMVLTGPSACLP
jgi:uncharacterized membrane protein (UPF0127 family)